MTSGHCEYAMAMLCEPREFIKCRWTAGRRSCAATPAQGEAGRATHNCFRMQAPTSSSISTYLSRGTMHYPPTRRFRETCQGKEVVGILERFMFHERAHPHMKATHARERGGSEGKKAGREEKTMGIRRYDILRTRPSDWFSASHITEH